jgi:hypothetical protein
MSLAISVGVHACGPDADPEAVEYDRKNFGGGAGIDAAPPGPLREEPGR